MELTSASVELIGDLSELALRLKLIPENASQSRPAILREARAQLDTGSDVNIISESTAKVLGLLPQAEGSKITTQFQGLGGPIDTLGKVKLSFSTGPGPAGKEYFYREDFHVLSEEPASSFDVILGRDFLDKSSGRLPSSSSKQVQSHPAETSAAKQAQFGPVPQVKSISALKSAEPADRSRTPESVPIITQPSPLKLHIPDSGGGLTIFEPANPNHAYHADVLIIVKPKPRGVRFSLLPRILSPELPDVQWIDFAWTSLSETSSLRSSRDYKQLGKQLLKSLSVERRNNKKIGDVPLIALCDSFGRMILQSMLQPEEVSFVSTKQPLPDTESDSALARHLQQRLQAVLVLDSKPSRALFRALKASQNQAQCSITYLRPLSSTGFPRVLLQAFHVRAPVEAGASLIYLDVKAKNFTQFKDADDEKYRLVVQLLRAHVGVSVRLQERLQRTNITQPSHVGPAEVVGATGSITAHGNSTVVAYSAEQVNATGNVYIGQAGRVNVTGNSNVQIQDCRDVFASDNAIIQIKNAGSVHATGNSILSTGKDTDATTQPILSAAQPKVQPEEAKSIVTSGEGLAPNMPRSRSPRPSMIVSHADDSDTPLAPLAASETPTEHVDIRLESLRSQAKDILKKLHGELSIEPDHSVASVEFEWEVLKFLEEDFHTGQKLKSVFVLIGNPERPAGLTCGEYMLEKWPRVGAFVLETVQYGLAKLAKQSPSERSYSQESRKSPVHASQNVSETKFYDSSNVLSRA
jgi:hypothetical protein